jgi:hypothetical protein
MAVRIRVYPQYGGYGMNPMYGGFGRVGAYGAHGPWTENQVLKTKVRHQRQTSSLRLQYERALWQQRLQMAQLEAAARYGGLGGVVSPLALGMGAHPSLVGANAALLGANPLMLGGLGGYGMGGRGQMNLTNQVSLGAGTQHVSNSNVSNHRHYDVHSGGWGWW